MTSRPVLTLISVTCCRWWGSAGVSAADIVNWLQHLGLILGSFSSSRWYGLFWDWGEKALWRWLGRELGGFWGHMFLTIWHIFVDVCPQLKPDLQRLWGLFIDACLALWRWEEKGFKEGVSQAVEIDLCHGWLKWVFFHDLSSFLSHFLSLFWFVAGMTNAACQSPCALCFG